jgi:hypothetical protein
MDPDRRQTVCGLQSEESPMTDRSRPSNLESENETLCPAGDGKPPRPATEPAGAGNPVDSPKTVTDPGSGEPQGRVTKMTRHVIHTRAAP